MSNIGWFECSDIRGVPDLWTPARIPTALWLDAADSESIVLTDGLVSQWKDKSGNGRHTAQSTSSLRPVHFNNGIIFTSDRLDLPVAAWPPTGFTLIALMIASTTGSVSVGLININSSPADDPELRIGLGDDVMNYYNGGYAIQTSAANCTSLGIVSLEHSEDTKATLRKNGDIVAEGTVAGSLSTTAEFTLGCYGRIGLHRNGTIHELLVFANDSKTREKVEGYLAHKWGLK